MRNAGKDHVVRVPDSVWKGLEAIAVLDSVQATKPVSCSQALARLVIAELDRREAVGTEQ